MITLRLLGKTQQYAERLVLFVCNSSRDEQHARRSIVILVALCPPKYLQIFDRVCLTS